MRQGGGLDAKDDTPRTALAEVDEIAISAAFQAAGKTS
tara:strand:+ start:17451 stop:17564 length:114 start_codon:yes stop_codon:yes gene_type:complete